MSKPGILYILDTGVGMKIGITERKLSSRIQELSPVYRLLFVHAIAHRNPKSLEKALHQKFVDKRVSHLPSREIFALSLQDVEWIKSIIRFQGHPCVHLVSLLEADRHAIKVIRRYHLSSRR